MRMIASITVAIAAIAVIDGDTIRWRGETFRLVGIDAPEIGSRSRCDTERALGYAARSRLQAILAEGTAVIQSTGHQDKYHRTLARVFVGGRDAGQRLIAEGLARPWRGKTSDWCATAPAG